MPRSTRNMIKYHWECADNMLVRSLEHLQALDEYADGNSPVINEVMPILVKAYDGLKQLLAAFRERL